MAAYTCLFVTALIASQALSGAWRIDLSMASDAPGHFVSGLMIHDYLADAAGSNPMQFAKSYYVHYPRVAIGHWPPLFPTLEAVADSLVGRSLPAAFAVMACITGLLGAVCATIARRAQGALAGLAVGLAVIASPEILFQVNTVMADGLLALLMLLATLAWVRYAQAPSVAGSLLFAAAAAAAIMTKGNGIGLALLPPFHALLSGRGRVLFAWQTWLAAALIAAPVVPWYALTYRIAADGFNHPWGWPYTSLALPAFSRMLLVGSGWLAGIAAAIGAVAACRGQHEADAREAPYVGLVALVAAAFVFTCLVPADINARYMIPVTPALLLLAARGFQSCLQAARLRPAALAPGVAGLLLLNLATVYRAPHASTLHMDAVGRLVMNAPERNPLVLAAGGPHAEGALIAAFAAADTGRHYWVLRGSKLLGSANFMGTDYRPRFQTAGEVAAWLADRRIGWLVFDDSPESLLMLHDRQVAQLLAAPPPNWHMIASFANGIGTTRLVRLDGPEPTPAILADITRQAAATKVIGSY